ncbi:MOSC domain-containing protein [Pseudooctadecabacter jejudonensis]|uniref:Putative metal-sulfur cluster biosynthesis proteins YuaD n=1 Tax=Pseudooctadecabacter jejudonensis TaxID=1391910 RepID=A0A1Y5SVV7_9RHOB|nr:MOSC domain-containing protein [Pseudooctadecabacter jejudonensis]SLN49816.1 Putative metal-sulfur cluster biosynthesis proteins YuaD [Pseudooctadecabacter jejudonensis]
MPALKPTEYTADVVWIGALETEDRTALKSVVRDHLDLTFEGIAAECHNGLTRPSCSRVSSQYAKGTAIKNERQLCIISEEELTQIAAKMGLDAIDPARLGATIMVRGLPDLTFVPPSSRLQAPSGATVTVDMENRPCHLVTRSLQSEHGDLDVTFKTAAKNLRGVTAWVAAEGRINLGDRLTLHIPDQRAWQPS